MNKGYNPNADLQIEEKSFKGKKNSVSLGTYSYDGGAVKYQLGRFYLKNGFKNHMKLGRLTAEELQGVVDMATEFLQSSGTPKVGQKDEDNMNALNSLSEDEVF